MANQIVNYSNPRMKAVIENWPSGGHRVTAIFNIDVKKGKGERATRQTTGSIKKLTFARKVRIVDGDDGHTYIAELAMYNHITIKYGAMKFDKETIFPDDPRYLNVHKFFD